MGARRSNAPEDSRPRSRETEMSARLASKGPNPFTCQQYFIEAVKVT